MMDRLAWMGTGWREAGFGIGSDSKKSSPFSVDRQFLFAIVVKPSFATGLVAR